MPATNFMKKTLSELLDPSFNYYRSLGELARTLQYLMQTAEHYRQPGRWGESGPTETLNGYHGCTNSNHTEWHSDRQSFCFFDRDHDQAERRPFTTWQQNHDSMYSCILAAICGDRAAERQWRKEKGIDLHMLLKFPMAYQHADKEIKAWDAVTALHGLKLPVDTLNPCHRRVNVLCFPQITISRESISLKMQVTQRYELRSTCPSSWGACYLAGVDNPAWRPSKETFADFLLRTVEFHKALQPRPEMRKHKP